MWVADPQHQEIYRRVTCSAEAEARGWCRVKCPAGEAGCTEYYEQSISTAHRDFRNYRCFEVNDLNRLVEEAMRQCRGK